jgi:hypothetical protein
MVGKRKSGTAVETTKTKEEVDRREELIDAGSELSFPASDPPSYMGGSAIAGPPPSQPQEPAREPSVTTVSDPEAVKAAKQSLPTGAARTAAVKEHTKKKAKDKRSA